MTTKEMNEDIQNKTTDKGWSAMQVLLDRDMPTERKRRWLIGWWLVLLSVPVAIFGSWHIWSNITNDQLPLEEPGKASAVPFATVQSTSSGISATNETIGQSENPEYRNEALLSDHTGQTKINNSLPALPRLPIIGNQKSVETSQDIVDAQFSTKPEQPELAKATLRLAALSNFSPISIDPNLVSSQLTKSTQNPKPVTVLPFEPSVTKKSQDANWTFGGSAMVATEKFNRINSAGIGAAMQWQPTRRWGIRSGLYYNNSTPSLSSQPTATIRAGQYEQASVTGYEVTDLDGNKVNIPATVFSQQQPIIIPVSKLQMMEVPLLVSWQLARSIKLFSGFNTGYLLAAKARNTSYLGNFTLTVNSDSGVQNLSTLAKNDIGRWRFDFQAGIGIAINRKLELAAFAKFPIQGFRSDMRVLEDSNGGYFQNYKKVAEPNLRIPSISIQATCFFNSK